MEDALSIYLQDHLAGANFGVELVEALEHDHGANELGRAASVLKNEIKADQATLREIVSRVGANASKAKEVLSWIAEKATRLKLRRQGHGDLGTFETLETLALGILGKEKLWQALKMTAADDARLAGIDFGALEQRARDQHQRVETFRLQFAVRALAVDRAGN